MKYTAGLILLFASIAAHAVSDNVIPFTLTPTGMMVVNLKIEGKEGRFLIDTGSNGTIVAPRIAAKADLSRNFALVDNTLGTKTKSPQTQLCVSLPHVRFNILVTVMDVDGFDGIIGMDVLGKFKKVHFDLRSHTLTLVY
jgi:predicted aspartyl protease